MEITNTELTLKKNIKKLREKAELSGYMVAKKIGINSTYYYRMEDLNVHQQIGYHILEKLAALYDVSVSDLFSTNVQ